MMKSAKSVASSARIAALYRRLRKPLPLYAEIGRNRIHLPANSQLLNYKKAFQLYDSALGRIAGILKEKYPDLHAIDIGANAGDTAALIRESADIPVLCIEGDPAVLPFLKENIGRLGPGVEVDEHFVGPEDAEVDLSAASDLGSNACLVGATASHGSVKLRSLEAILDDHPDFRSAKLLKSDTEGFDFATLQQSIEFIGQAKPVIFFEYDPHFRLSEPKAGIETLEALMDAGYSDFIYYDNFGNFLLHTPGVNRGLLNDLDCYLRSNRRHGTAVYYFDVCALHSEDADLIVQIRTSTQR